MVTLRPGPHIRYAFVEEHLVVLDLSSESYVLFEPVAASMWREQLACGSRATALSNLARHYAVGEAELAGDYDAFLGRCRSLGYLAESPAPPVVTGGPIAEKSGLPRCLTLRAWCSLYRTARELSRQGFAQVYQALGGPPVGQLHATTVERSLLAAVRGFARAENFFHLRRAPDDCLPRSLALFRFLRRLGFPVEHHIGVRLFPFAAHAWVEHQGRVLRDSPDNCAGFTTIARISA